MSIGFNGSGHGPVFGTILGPNLNSVSVLVSVLVNLGHGSVRFGLNFSLQFSHVNFFQISKTIFKCQKFADLEV